MLLICRLSETWISILVRLQIPDGMLMEEIYEGINNCTSKRLVIWPSFTIGTRENRGTYSECDLLLFPDREYTYILLYVFLSLSQNEQRIPGLLFNNFLF